MDKMKLKLLLICMAAILLTLFTQPALAYYTVIGKATNVVTSGNVELAIHERTAEGSPFPEEGVYIIPGDIIGKVVTVENVCNHPFYLRVALSNGSDNDRLDPSECFHMDINEAYWKQRPDGYYYYHRVLQPGETTEFLFSQVEIIGEAVDQTHVGSVLTLTVNAYAVQSEHNPADNPWEAQGWPAV